MIGWGLLYEQDSENFRQFIIKYHDGTSYKRVKPYVYKNGQWMLCGSTNEIMQALVDSNNLRVKEYNEKQEYVRYPANYQFLTSEEEDFQTSEEEDFYSL